ncbi:MAG: hypothetical protein ACI9T8_000307 [Candidatus Saccharimonadales bacterium]|jgi:hypothetical protein
MNSGTAIYQGVAVCATASTVVSWLSPACANRKFMILVYHQLKQAIIKYMQELWQNINKKNLLSALTAFLLGVIFLIAVRFVVYKDTSVHYHANFAVFVDSERELFNNFTFYEEIQSCGGDSTTNPKVRVHMHDQVNHVIHVHDDAATWGHFFANISMTAGDDLFKTASETYVEGVNDVEIRYLLNGTEVQTIANRTISSEDVLLISIGSPTDELLQSQNSEITKDAGEYNERADPATCSGSQELSVMDRLERAIRFWE